MKWTLTDTGELIDPSGNKRIQLTEAEQDAAIIALKIPITTMSTIKKTARSYSGMRLMDSIPDPNPIITESTDCDPLFLKLYEFGGDRLVTLYCCDWDVHIAAEELGLKYGCLSKWFLRFRARLVRDNIKPCDIGLVW